VIYLLDTNACIALMKGDAATVRARYRAAEAAGHMIATSSVVAAELWYGVGKSRRKTENAQAVSALLSAVRALPFEEDDARAAGVIRVALESEGTPIGAYDTLIAGHALGRGAVLITANVAEFARVAGLTWENWALTRFQSVRNFVIRNRTVFPSLAMWKEARPGWYPGERGNGETSFQRSPPAYGRRAGNFGPAGSQGCLAGTV
jgi:tRNA(fMet)-specific endonuclease VapC